MKSKKLWIALMVTAVVLVLIFVIIWLLTREESYRVVKIYEFDGTATVSRKDLGEIEMYPNMVLQSGDEVYFEEGLLTLKLDEDKYVYVEEQTKFQLHTSGNADTGKTSIHLLQGAITNELQSPLASDASYEVHTQNSSMSVRGTVFRVEVYRDEEGVLYTRVSVFDGKVQTQLVYKDGTKADPRMVEYGKETIIYESDVNTDYLDGITDIEYETISEAALKVLSNLVKDGLSLSILPEELATLIGDKISGEDSEPDDLQEDASEDETEEAFEEDSEEESEEDEETESDESSDEEQEESNAPVASVNTYTVTFVCDGSTFATQTVAEGGRATEPSLMPASSGSWDFDFTTVINKDITVYWK